MGKRYLIDTNAIHDYLQELYPEKGLVKMDKVLAQEANISVISKIEYCLIRLMMRALLRKLSRLSTTQPFMK
jgi:glutathione S-transferase